MISNEKANLLFSLEKQTKDNSIELPNPNEIVSIELESVDELIIYIRKIYSNLPKFKPGTFKGKTINCSIDNTISF